jgi:hypothetical protein
MPQTLHDCGHWEKHTFLFAGQIPCGCKPLCQYTLTELFPQEWGIIQEKAA